MRTRPFAIFVALLICGASLQAASFVVPDDLDFFKRADAVVIATPLTSYTRMLDSGAIQTVTTFSIEDVIKGAITDQTIDVIEPGGVFGSKATIVPGVPRFQDGNRYLLFLMQSAREWHIRDLALGKNSRLPPMSPAGTSSSAMRRRSPGEIRMGRCISSRIAVPHCSFHI